MKSKKLTPKMVNDKLGVKIFDELFNGFKLIQYNQKQIKDLFIDDLIIYEDEKCKYSNRLLILLHEMQEDFLK